MGKIRTMRDEKLVSGAAQLVGVEREYAKAVHGSTYHSPAEGYMVIREEVLELADEVKSLQAYLNILDRYVRKKLNVTAAKACAESISRDAIAAAIEAIHVAAAAEKLAKSYDEAPTRYFQNRKDSDE